MKKTILGAALCLALLGAAPSKAEPVRELVWIPMPDQGVFGAQQITAPSRGLT